MPARRLLARLFPALLAAALLLPPNPAAALQLWDPDWSKERKAAVANIGAGAAVLAWGAAAWDWGSGGPRFQDEGWFTRNTTEGGADKIGHAWTAYTLGHLFSNRYQEWGFSRGEAAFFGAASSTALMTLVELGDSISDVHGFSVQDQLFNLAGAGLAWLLWDRPDLARKVDFRVEYDPFAGEPFQADFFTDYERLKYLVAIKADGFDGITNPLLRHLEVHLGFYARGYRDFDAARPDTDRRRRYIYAGIGINVTRLLRPHVDTGLFNYIQAPYTYLPARRNVDR